MKIVLEEVLLERAAHNKAAHRAPFPVKSFTFRVQHAVSKRMLCIYHLKSAKETYQIAKAHTYSPSGSCIKKACKTVLRHS